MKTTTGQLLENIEYLPAGLPAAIIHFAAHACGLAPADITGRSRRQDVSDARHIAAHLIRQAGYSLPAIGRALGRHHTTVLASLRQHQALCQHCQEFRGKAEAAQAAMADEAFSQHRKNQRA